MKREILEKVGLKIRSIPPDSFKPTFSNSYARGAAEHPVEAPPSAVDASPSFRAHVQSRFGPGPNIVVD